MRRVLLLVLLAAAAVGGVIVYLRITRPENGKGELVLYGNVDLRQAELAFNNNERVEAVLVQEGDRVGKGQVLARLDATRLEPQVAQAEGQVAAQKQVWLRLKNGSRPEEIDQARANVASARADAKYAKRLYDHNKAAWDSAGGHAVTLRELEDSEAALSSAEARVIVQEKALELAVLGPRAEEVAEAEARLHAAEAQLAYLKKQLADTVLVAPADAVVRTRIMEPGEMASPIRPALLLALIDPKWVRAYVNEPDLPRVHPGVEAAISVDAFPGRRYAGWVGFVSPTAEFTPKNVQTEELRTSLVYEVRIFVRDPDDDLRLGMPVTARVKVEAASPAPVTSTSP
ncbi:MAG TPA: efflux RND transporter periplasmic adaptor subunit [Planctomycetota bacterium]|nr:efflux RND transporter periplasmic adaptor subunit [Planctomycetota bacterium]